MGFVTFVGTLSFLFAGTWRHSSFPSTECMSLCLEASPERSSDHHQQQAISPFNRTAAKYGLEKAKEIYSDNARKRTEKYGSLFNLTAQKYGLERAKEIWSESARKRTEEYGTVWDRMKSKHGLGKANEINRENVRKALETRLEKYTMEEIQQMSSEGSVEAARKQGKYTRYPGVNFDRAKGKWRVKFSHKGKMHRAGAAHVTEQEAAEAHDDYVRRLGLNRPLHFPRKGERTSYVDKPSDNA